MVFPREVIVGHNTTDQIKGMCRRITRSKNALIVVQPGTVIRWHRKGFKLFWKFKSRARRIGRPSIDSDIRKLIEDTLKMIGAQGLCRIDF